MVKCTNGLSKEADLSNACERKKSQTHQKEIELKKKKRRLSCKNYNVFTLYNIHNLYLFT